MKKIHKLHNVSKDLPITVNLPMCKVHNKTYAYKGSTKWAQVTCEKCLKKRKEK